MSFDINPDNLIVMDSSDGIFELNMKTGEKVHLVSEKAEIGTSVRHFWFKVNKKKMKNLTFFSHRELRSFSIPSRLLKTEIFSSLTRRPILVVTKFSWVSLLIPPVA